MAAHSLGSVKVLVQVLDLLGLPPLGVPRLDDAPALADLVDAKAKPAVTPPAYGTTITQPTPPSPTPTPTPVPPAADRPARHLTRHRPARPAHNHRTPDRPGR